MMFSFLFVFLACKSPPNTAIPEQPMMRYRIEEASSDVGRLVVEKIPKAQWDKGLYNATQELLAALSSPVARITPESVQVATARAGFPGQARFAKMLNGGEFPQTLVDEIIRDCPNNTVDVALAKRSYGDGSTLWLIGWARHIVEIDPIPRQVPLDGAIPIRVEIPSTERGYLYIAPPDQPIEIVEILPEAHRWLNDFHTPGPYRFELVTDGPDGPQVALLFSLYVDEDPPSPKLLFPQEITLLNPKEAEEWLYQQVNILRRERGLRSLKKFALFEGVAREHSAWMATTGIVNHSIAGVTPGVPTHAARLAHPRAKHYENVVAAGSAEEALLMTIDSPGHFRVLLCETCTHISIGAALEPKLSGHPRIFVTWEVLEFPQGEPLPIEKLNRY